MCDSQSTVMSGVLHNRGKGKEIVLSIENLFRIRKEERDAFIDHFSGPEFQASNLMLFK